MKELWTWKEIALIAVILAAVGMTAAHLWKEHSAQARGAAVMEGKVIANITSGIFYVPTCPQYASLDLDSARLFDTVSEAEDADFRASRNCSEAIDFRRNCDHGYCNDDEESHDYDPPY